MQNIDGAKKNQAIAAGGISGIQTVDGEHRNKGGVIQAIEAAQRGLLPAGVVINPYLVNLISYYKLDEVSGVRSDIHGSNHLTDNNTVDSDPLGKISRAASFNSLNSESLSVTDNASIRLGDIDFTYSFWAQRSLFGANRCMMSFGGTGGTQGLVYMWVGDGNAYFDLYDTGGAGIGEVSSGATFSNSVWYHFIIWHDSVANTINMQVNNGTVRSAATTGAPNGGSTIFEIGSNSSGTANFWDGLIDEVGFWKRTLTVAERAALYNAGSGYAYPFS